MELPKTEKELRLMASASVKAFLQELENGGVDVQNDLMPIYKLYDIKAAGIWIARYTLRELCPHLANEAERDLSDEFSEGEDTPL